MSVSERGGGYATKPGSSLPRAKSQNSLTNKNNEDELNLILRAQLSPRSAPKRGRSMPPRGRGVRGRGVRGRGMVRGRGAARPNPFGTGARPDMLRKSMPEPSAPRSSMNESSEKPAVSKRTSYGSSSVAASGGEQREAAGASGPSTAKWRAEEQENTLEEFGKNVWTCWVHRSKQELQRLILVYIPGPRDAVGSIVVLNPVTLWKDMVKSIHSLERKLNAVVRHLLVCSSVHVGSVASWVQKHKSDFPHMRAYVLPGTCADELDKKKLPHVVLELANNPLPELMPDFDVHPFQIIPEGHDVRGAGGAVASDCSPALELVCFHGESGAILCGNALGSTALKLMRDSPEREAAFWPMKAFPGQSSAIWMNSVVADRVKWNPDLIFLAEASASKLRQWPARRFACANFVDGRVKGDVMPLLEAALSFIEEAKKELNDPVRRPAQAATLSRSQRQRSAASTMKMENHENDDALGGDDDDHKDGVMDLRQFLWYHGRVDADDASKSLVKREKGTFLVRCLIHAGRRCFCICWVKKHQHVVHTIFYPNDKGWSMDKDGKGGRFWPSMLDVLRVYAKAMPLPLNRLHAKVGAYHGPIVVSGHNPERDPVAATARRERGAVVASPSRSFPIAGGNALTTEEGRDRTLTVFAPMPNESTPMTSASFAAHLVPAKTTRPAAMTVYGAPPMKNASSVSTVPMAEVKGHSAPSLRGSVVPSDDENDDLKSGGSRAHANSVPPPPEEEDSEEEDKEEEIQWNVSSLGTPVSQAGGERGRGSGRGRGRGRGVRGARGGRGRGAQI